MSQKQVSPMVKAALEYGPLIGFFLAYFLLKDRDFSLGGETYSGFIAVTAVFVPILVLATLIQWRLTGVISVMQIVTIILVTVFGGLTVWLNDERFFKMKPTLIYLIFAGVLGFGLLRGRSYLKFVMGAALPLQERGWMVLTQRVTLAFLGLAILNEVIWRTQSTEFWVTFKTFGLSIILFGFFMTQGGLLQRYALEKDGENGADGAPKA